jgi:hypothetical protein
MSRLMFAFLILGSLFMQAQTTMPAAAVELTIQPVVYKFGEYALFKAELRNPDQQGIQEITILYRSQGKTIQAINFDLPTSGDLAYSLDLKGGALRPFAQVDYWFQVKLSAGSVVKSAVSSFTYEDNRFTWQLFSEGRIVVHWVEGDTIFGQAIYNSADTGLRDIQNLLQLPQLDKPVNIYVYSHARDLQSAMELGGQEWIAGHASPDLGVVLISIAPGPEQKLQMEKQVPHELTHILLYLKTGAGYAQQPVWLLEGLASITERFRNSDYSVALDAAKQNQSLLPLAGLCNSFPKDASNAFLAYAEADSFTRFLQSNFGTSGLIRLIDQYSDGLGCGEGFKVAFQIPLSLAESRWRQEVLGIDLGSTAILNLLPYLVMFGVILLFPILPGLFGRHKQGKSPSI